MRRWPQFSLAALAALVAFIALACCALMYASHTWAASLQTVGVVFVMLAITAAVYRRGGARAFWLGSGIWGGAYFLLSSSLLSNPQTFDTFGRPTNYSVGTTQLSLWVYEHVLPKLLTPPVRTSGGMPGVGSLGEGGGMPTGYRPPAPAPASFYPDQESFLRVAQALWLWVFALVGGGVGRWLHATCKPN
jgi:hypothetical protein